MSTSYSKTHTYNSHHHLSHPLVKTNYSHNNYLFSISYRTVVIGDSGVGKTSLIRRLSEGIFHDDTQSTIGIDFSHLVANHNSPWIGRSEIYIWDTAGQEMYNALVQNYVRRAAVALVIYDVSDRSTFENLKTRWFKTLDQYPEIYPILIGNKSDRPSQVSLEEAAQLAEQRNIPLIQMSVKTNNRVNYVMRFLHEIIVKRVESCFKEYTKSEDPSILSRDEWYNWTQQPDSLFYQRFYPRVKILHYSSNGISSRNIIESGIINIANSITSSAPKCC